MYNDGLDFFIIHRICPLFNYFLGTRLADEPKQIGEFARYLNQQKNLYLTLIHKPDFIQNGFGTQYKTWDSEILEEHDKRLENVPDECFDYYLDVDCATFELISAIVRADLSRQKSDFKEKTQKFVRQFDERLTPYLEW